MARKRKIPVRKHHGVRDPLKQLEQKEKKLANVTNNPPTQSDEQRTSHKFKQFQRIAEAAKTGKKLRLGTIGKEDIPKSKNTRKAPVGGTGSRQSIIKQYADEADVDYLRRVNRITNASVKEAQYEAKYGVKVIRNHITGEITLEKQPKNEIDELLKQKQKDQRNSKKTARRKVKAPTNATMDEKTRKELIKRAYTEPDDTEEEDTTPAEYKRDVFKFGETVHAPPTLKTLPRKASANETVPRPGRKTNLLLKSLMDPATTTTATSSTSQVSVSQKKKPTTAPTKQQLKGKRKDLPAATRNMLDGERSKMIDLYRALKKKQSQTKHV